MLAFVPRLCCWCVLCASVSGKRTALSRPLIQTECVQSKRMFVPGVAAPSACCVANLRDRTYRLCSTPRLHCDALGLGLGADSVKSRSPMLFALHPLRTGEARGPKRRLLPSQAWCCCSDVSAAVIRRWQRPAQLWSVEAGLQLGVASRQTL